MSPVEMCGMAKSSRRRSACVPLPAPGGPSSIRFSSDTTGADYPLDAGACGWLVAVAGGPSRRRGAGELLEEALVTSHHQLRLQLLHRFERYPDHDQDRGPTEVEVLVGACEQDRGEGRHG